MAEVVVVKFKKGCKPYYFGKGGLSFEKGQGVVVETSKGLEYAIVVEPSREVPDEAIVQPLKNVIRIATEKDEAAVAAGEARRGEAMRICKEKIEAHNLPMKLIDCEFAFDGSKVVFTFTAEGRVDFRELVRDLASVFHIRIELRQVGIRDEARILGGIAPCGREVCCAGCMPDFKKVSVKMAKNQGLSLNPGKISGLCGRLMCCLSYEDEYYAAACKKVPKLGATVATPEGKGQVVSVNMLKMEVRVKIEKDGALIYRDFAAEDVSRAEPDRPDVRRERTEAPAADTQPEEGEVKILHSARGEEQNPRPREKREKPAQNRVAKGGQPERREAPQGTKEEARKQPQQGAQFRSRRNRFKGGKGGNGNPDKNS